MIIRMDIQTEAVTLSELLSKRQNQSAGESSSEPTAAQPSDGSAATLIQMRVAGRLQSQSVGAAISQQPPVRACAAALTRSIRRRSRRRGGGRRVEHSPTKQTSALLQSHRSMPPSARPSCAPCASWPWRACGLRRRCTGPWGRGWRCWRRERCLSRGRGQRCCCCCCASSCCAGVAGGCGCWRVVVGRLVACGCGPLVAARLRLELMVAAVAAAAAAAVW